MTAAKGTVGMKVYISVDIEGAAGITHWDEARKSHADYPEFREEMTREAVAACEGSPSRWSCCSTLMPAGRA